MSSEEIISAIKQICEEKNISFDSVVESIEYALAAAYRKDFGQKNQNIKVEFDPQTGKMKVFDEKLVVENLKEEKEGEEKKKFNPKTEIPLDEARKIKKNVKVGETIRQELKVPSAFGRVAAQTAKQVITQRLKEAEKEAVYKEFKAKEGELVNGVVQQREGRGVLVDLDHTTAILPQEEQIRQEDYRPGRKMKFLILSVKETSKGPEVILSRAHPLVVKALFLSEIPEIQAGTVEIKSIAREAGFRSKVAVDSKEENIDPIGSCIGQRGARVQTIISELGGEKIDIVRYDDDPVKYISNALSPAKITDIELKEKEKVALVKVKPDQFSLAIGKAGQNVRLASRLTGWKIEIKEISNSLEESVKDGEGKKEEKEKQEKEEEEKKEKKEEGNSKKKKTKKKNSSK